MAFLLTVQICYAIIVTNINRNLEADCFCHLLFNQCPIVDFRWARGADARETTQERGEALLRRLSPLSLRFSLSRSPFPDSLLSVWFHTHLLGSRSIGGQGIRKAVGSVLHFVKHGENLRG